jgi:hypothetical protein
MKISKNLVMALLVTIATLPLGIAINNSPIRGFGSIIGTPLGLVIVYFIVRWANEP